MQLSTTQLIAINTILKVSVKNDLVPQSMIHEIVASVDIIEGEVNDRIENEDNYKFPEIDLDSIFNIKPQATL